MGGVCYHVLNCGNGRAEVFHKKEDFVALLDLMEEASERLPMRLLAWCLIPNHFHLVLWPHEDGDLSRWMQWLLTSHVRRYHRHYHGSGHVWQGRFKAFPIEEDEHLWTVLRYVERNALRRILCGAEDWLWSSAGALAAESVRDVASRPAAAQQGLAGLGQPSAKRGGIGGTAKVHRTRHALRKRVVATRHRRATRTRSEPPSTWPSTIRKERSNVPFCRCRPDRRHRFLRHQREPDRSAAGQPPSAVEGTPPAANTTDYTVTEPSTPLAPARSPRSYPPPPSVRPRPRSTTPEASP